MKTVLASIVLGCCVFAGRFLSVTCRRSPVHHRRRVGDPCASSDDTTANARSQTFSLKKQVKPRFTKNTQKFLKNLGFFENF